MKCKLWPMLAALLLTTSAHANSPWFGAACPQAFEDIAQRSDLELRAATIRAQHLKRLKKPFQVEIDGQIYTANQRIGTSSGIVYLGRDSRGRTVIIKKYRESDNGGFLNLWDQVVNDELAKTERYGREPGGPPPVIAVDIKQHVIVKEYFSGLTLRELELNQKPLGLTTQQFEKLRLELAYEIRRWEGLKKELDEELRVRSRGAHSLPDSNAPRLPTNPLDVKVANFIYSFSQKRWIFFDP
jgi:hypothetical protein